MYEVFVNGNLLLLTATPVLSTYEKLLGAKMTQVSVDELRTILPNLTEGIQIGNFYCTDDPKKALAICKKGRKTVRAAGGIILNNRGEILLIRRLGWWDLPKGKQDEGERIHETAIREVQEECGLKSVRIIRPAGISRHTYFRKKQCFKTTWWYLMRTTDIEFIPQIEEDITEIRFVHPDRISEYYAEMYPGLRLLINNNLSSIYSVID
jgi:8-oxo-dGTP pyrophosphatase MutT (NUDIX family)